MSSDEALHRNDGTTESNTTETASSPEPEQNQTPPAQEAAPEESQQAAPTAESQPAGSESPGSESSPSEPSPGPNTSSPQNEPVSADHPTSEPAPPQPGQESASDPSGPSAATPSAEPPTAEPASAGDSTSASSPPPSPQPAQETSAEETAAANQVSPESRPRPQLNPKVDPNAAKPVPNLDSAPPASPPSETSEGPAGETETPAPPPSAETSPPSTPAEIPQSADLDADLEAQIAAAQASDDATGSQPVPAPQPPEAEGTEGGPAAPPAETPAPTSEEELEPGYKMGGKVQSIAGDDVFFDVGFRSPALVSLRQFDPQKPPQVGQTYQIIVDKVNAAEGLIHANLPRGRRKIQGNWDAVAVGQVVDCMVSKTNKGGLEITVSNLRGFLPASQVDLYYVPDLEKYVGQKLTVKITEANRAKRNLIVSRRAYLKEEREVQAREVWANLEVGQAKKGVVKTIKDYGAFVDIGGVDGFLHIGEISWTRIRHPSDALSEGQEIDVQILSIDQDRERIGLGMRQLTQNPWDTVTQKYPQGTPVSGRVTRTTDFGAFVELEPGVEGLVHISELDYRRVNKVTDVLNVGDQPELQVLDLDLGRKRISLSLKALQEKPPELDKKKPEKKSDEDLAPGGGENYNRKRKGPLKGGTGGSGGGGLFGDPGDFSG